MERIGGQATLKFVTDGTTHQEHTHLASHEVATQHLFDWLTAAGFLQPGGIEAIGHRVVHGGSRFLQPTRLDDSVIAALDALGELAPLHNGPALAAIRAARAVSGTRIPMVAVFDTAFHHTMPAWAAQYALPEPLTARHAIRRYGFHGLAHRFMSERYAALRAAPGDHVPQAVRDTPAPQHRIITLQLGSGCSAAAIAAGCSVDTSMGFTPLEGLMMGTRCGDIDPAIPGFLARQEGVDLATIDTWLNTASGLLGISGHSRDMRELLAAEAQGNTRVALAINMFCYRVRKYIGAYLAALNGAEALVFGGGIGEHAPGIRARICAQMEWCGLTLDATRNTAAQGTEARISADAARLHAYVIPVDEASVIARDTVACLREL
jgi:acetate kinase